jgi:hypothetical protein
MTAAMEMIDGDELDKELDTEPTRREILKVLRRLEANITILSESFRSQAQEISLIATKLSRCPVDCPYRIDAEIDEENDGAPITKHPR